MTKLTPDDSKLWHVQQCPLFSVLTDEEKDTIAKTLHMIELERNKVVPPPPEDGPALYIVKKGHVELTFVDEEGNEAAVMILGPGDVFGALTGDDSQLYGEHCRTITEAYLCSIGRERFEGLLKRFPDLAFRLTKLSMLRIQKLQVRLAEMMMRPAESRLALAFLELDDQIGREHSSGGRKLSLPLSHSDLGKLIGTSREMVTVIMKRFREAGLVETPKRWIVLKDMEGLREVSGGKKIAEVAREASKTAS